MRKSYNFTHLKFSFSFFIYFVAILTEQCVLSGEGVII